MRLNFVWLDRFLWPHGGDTPIQFDCLHPKTNRLIADLIRNKSPAMICRFGSVEMRAFQFWLEHNHSFTKNYFRRVFSSLLTNDYPPDIISSMEINAGFWPATKSFLDAYSELLFKSLPLVDLLGAWIGNEERLRRWMPKAKFVHLRHLDPWWDNTPYDPWSAALAGLKVLVIHPFADTIKKQYAERRKLLFPGTNVLPVFDLKVVKAPQRIARNSDGHSTWFESYNWLKSECEKYEFDIAIIGAGAFGFPLAAHLKRCGKKAFHLGGVTQLLFGIRGKRWDDKPEYRGLSNEHWVYPSKEERPASLELVEGGCYW